MESSNRIIIAVTYLLVGVIVGIVAFVGLRAYRGKPFAFEAFRNARQTTNRSDEARAGGRQVLRRAEIERLTNQRDQIKQLHALALEKSKKLEETTTLLERAKRDKVRLQDELDQASSLLDVLAENLLNIEDVSFRDTATQLRTEIGRLKQERETARLLSMETETELTLLEDELSTSSEQLQTIESESSAEQAASERRLAELRAAITDAMIRIGPESIPVLASMLEDNRASVRAFAARVLGQIGPAAREAIPPLIDRLADPDVSVREAVETALQTIDPVEQ